MISENLFRKLCSIVFLGYGIFLVGHNYKVEVDDYFSYKYIHGGEVGQSFQPLFNIFLAAFRPIDYDYSRFIVGLVICMFLAITIFTCRSRFWYILVLTFTWYLESLAIIHIRMGLAFALFALIYPRWRSPLWVFILSLVHYAVLIYFLIYIILRFDRIQTALLFCLCILFYSLLPWVEYFGELDQYRVYIMTIPDDYLKLALLGIFALVSLLMVSQGIFWRFALVGALAAFAKLFLGVELGGRLSSILVLYSGLIAAYPTMYTPSFLGQSTRFFLYPRARNSY